MSSTTNIHPDAVLRSLLERPTRSNVQKTLQALHGLCLQQYEAGSRDFTLGTIGRKAEAAGLFVARILYNPSSQIYKDLISAWAAYVGPAEPPPPKTLASNEFLMKIQDPSIRMLVGNIIDERNTLKHRLNLLKNEQPGVLDLRPQIGGARIIPGTQAYPMAVVMPAAQLTEMEREAIQTVVSPKFLEGRPGWSEGERGEIIINGREVFPLGFMDALRKMLGQGPKAGLKVIS